MLFTSPRYSILAQMNLMKSVDCKIMLAPEGRPSVIDAILESYEMRLHQIPTLDELFKGDHSQYPLDKTFEQARDEPLVVLHTSGTTGFPKPIVWTHDWAASFGRQREFAPPSGFDSSDRLLLGNRLLSLMPPFHVSSSNFGLSTHVVLPSPRKAAYRMLIVSRVDIYLSASWPFLVEVPSYTHCRLFPRRPG